MSCKIKTEIENLSYKFFLRQITWFIAPDKQGYPHNIFLMEVAIDSRLSPAKVRW